MSTKKLPVTFLVGLIFILAACSSATPAPPAEVPQTIPTTEGNAGPQAVPQTEEGPPPTSPCLEKVEGTKRFNFELPSANVGYCFLYPDDFNTVDSEIPGDVQFVGPPRGAAPEPVTAAMQIYVHPADGTNLQGFVQNQLAAQPAGLNISASEAALGSGTPAIVLDGMPGRLLTRHLFAEHGGYIYELVFSPSDPAAPEAQADMQRFFDAVRQTWVFTR